MPRGSTPVCTPSAAPCTAIAITTSSNAVLPARSPIPFTASSTWRAPARDRGERVRGGEAQVVLAMEREDRLRELGHAREELARSAPRT